MMATAANIDAASSRAAPARLRAAQSGLSPAVAIFSVSLLFPIFFMVGPVNMSPQRIVLIALAVPAFLRIVSDPNDRLRIPDVFLFLHVIWTVLVIGPRFPGRIVEFGGNLFLESYVAYLVGRAFIRNADGFVAYIKFLGLLVILSLPLAIPETLTGPPLIPTLLADVQFITTVEDQDIPGRLGLHRVQAVFGHPIHYGLWCSTAFALTFVGLRGEVSAFWRFLSTALIILGCFLALSSGAMLAVVAQGALIGWYLFSRIVRLPRRWLVLTLLIVALYIAIDLASTRTPVRVFMSYATFSPHNAFYRAEIFNWGVANLMTQPLIGIGLSDWFRPHWMHSASVDNFWLVIAMRSGFPAIVILAIGFLSPLYMVAKRNFDSSERLNRLRRAWLLLMVGMIFTLCTVHVWTAMFSHVFFLLGAGMWFVYAEPEDSTAQDTATPAPGTKTTSAPVYTRFPSHGSKRTQPLSRSRPAPRTAGR